MAKIIAITGSKAAPALGLMAAEAIKVTGRRLGHQVKVEVLGNGGPPAELPAEDIAAADVAIIAADVFVDRKRFDGKRTHAATASDAIRYTQALIEAAVGAPAQPDASHVGARPASPALADAGVATMVKTFVAITSCPTGIAHTFMAAKALERGAENLGYRIKVETQGSVGAKNQLTPEEIAAADAVVIAADTGVDTSRFAGKRLLQTTTKVALHDSAKLLNDALTAEVAGAATSGNLAGDVEKLKAQCSATRTGPYKHLMTGVSYMLPLVTAGGLLIALAFAIGGIHAGDAKETFAAALMQIGGGAAFQLYIPVLAAFIAYSIADRPGIAAGLVGGMLAQQIGAGFLGGIAAGFFAGYTTQGINKATPLPPNLAGLKPVLILPLISTLIVGLGMLYLIGPPVKYVLDAMTTWLNGLNHGNALLLGLVLGAMMGFDMGGPVNKAAYTFSVGLLASKVYGPMAATMAAGMTPPLGLALAATLFKSRFTADERDASKAAAVLGISFITEGAIPFAAKDPFRVIPCLMLGSAVTGSLSMLFGAKLVVPHGGVFVLAIPRAVEHLVPYVIAIVIGTLVTTIALRFAKKPAHI
ncbi:MAG: PTS fructose-like transporter subunit IIB [Tepidisphaeraceae bacterium]